MSERWRTPDRQVWLAISPPAPYHAEMMEPWPPRAVTEKSAMRCCRGLTCVFLVAGSFIPLVSCDDDPFHLHETTDVIGRVILPDGTPAAGATCEIIFDGLVFDVEFADLFGVFEFDDWPEWYEPFFVRGIWVEPFTGIVFVGSSFPQGTASSGNTYTGDIVLFPVDSIPLTEPPSPGSLAAAGAGFADLDQDGRLDLVIREPGTDKVAVSLARH